MEKIVKIANWLGRKFIALMLSLTFLLITGIFKPEKLSQLAPAVVGLYLAFVGGHAATDMMATKNATKTDVTTVKTKVEQKTEEAD